MRARCMISKLLLMAFVYSVVFGSNPLGSQNSSDTETNIETLNVVISIYKEMAADILGRFNPHLTKQQRKVTKNIKIDITLSENLQDVKAKREPTSGERSITISTGFLMTIGRLNQAFATSVMLNRIHDLYPFLYEIIKDLAEDYRRRVNYEARKAPILFKDFVKLSPDQEVFLQGQKQQFNKYFTLASYASLAFFLAHELGHHLLGHVNNPNVASKKSHQEEADADAFAVELLIRSGYNPLHALMPIIFYFTLHQLTADNDALFAATERMFSVLEKGVSEMASNKAVVDGLRQQGLWRQFDDFSSTLKTYRQDFNCLKQSLGTDIGFRSSDGH